MFLLSCFYFHVFTFMFLLSCFYFHVFTFMFLLSCFYFHVFTFMFLLSCFYFHVFTFMFLLSCFYFHVFTFIRHSYKLFNRHIRKIYIYRKKLANTAQHHEYMPDKMRIFFYFIQHVKNHTAGIK